MARSAEELGRILARLHWQCWRVDAPPLDVEPSELMAVLPILIQSGSVGLLWPRIREQLDPSGAIAMALEHAYTTQIAHNEVCQREIAQSVARLREAGIEPLLVKGWAVSRLYPAPLVRPAGDIDLIVRHEDFAQAEAILSGPEAPPITVGLDLKHPATWWERPNEDFWDRTKVIEVDGVPVRVLGPEDQLRMLCLHSIIHGVSAPKWLVDIAVAVESAGSGFDWERAIGREQAERSWVLASIGLAETLLGADAVDGIGSDRKFALPRWLVPAVLQHWESPSPARRGALTQFLERPTDLVGILKDRWPEPTMATALVRAPINETPRLPVQVRAYGQYLIRHLGHGFWSQATAAWTGWRRRRELGVKP